MAATAAWVALAIAGTFSLSAQPARRAPSSIGLPDKVNQYASMASRGAWVALVWSGSSETAGANVYAAVSRDGGASFGRPARVNDVARQADVNGEQPPRVAFVTSAGETPQMVVVWTAKSAGGTQLLSARSTDGGRTFSASAPVPGSDAAGNRGWESIAADPGGGIHAVWLDHRDAASPGAAGHAGHQHGATAPDSSPEDGAARAQRSQLYVGSLDAGAGPRSIARGVCYCCKTAALTGPDGALYVAWRHVYPGNQRDIAFAVSRDRGRSFAAPVRVSEDRWQLDGCPENGPSLALGDRGRVFVLWPTLVKAQGSGESLRLFLSSTADGVRFTPRAALPVTGAAYHPQLVTTPDGTLFAAWDAAAAGGPRQIKVARGQPDERGQVTFGPVDLGSDTAGSYPVLAATPTHVVVAWTARHGSQSMITVTRLPLRTASR